MNSDSNNKKATVVSNDKAKTFRKAKTLKATELRKSLISNDKIAKSKNKSLIEKQRKFKDYSILDLLRYKSQRANFLIICFIWVTSSIIFYSLTIGLKKFSHEIYTNLYIIFSIDFMTCFFFGYLSNIHFFGRIKTIQLLMILSFIAFFSSLIIESSDIELENYIVLVSRVCFICVFCIIFFISTEIYPTVLRAKGLSYNSAFSRIGGFLAPFITERLDDPAKFKLFCFLNFICSVLTFYLPETLGKPLEEKIPEETSDYESD